MIGGYRGFIRSSCGLAAALLMCAAAGPARAQVAGFIEGRLSYPSDGLPADLKICAQPVEGGASTCTTRWERKGRDHVYRLTVPSGRYHVWAETTQMKGYRAYYTDYVVCGVKVSCPSHSLIVVEVRPGAVSSNVDPGDWYRP